MKQKYKMPNNPKRHAGLYSADKHLEIRLNLTSPETTQEYGHYLLKLLKDQTGMRCDIQVFLHLETQTCSESVGLPVGTEVLTLVMI